LTRPVQNSFLFLLALAVGLTPQLLPAISSINDVFDEIEGIFLSSLWGLSSHLNALAMILLRTLKVGRSEGNRWRTGRRDISRTPSSR
jgi:hypothetical protein